MLTACLITYGDKGPNIFLCRVFHITYTTNHFYGGESGVGVGMGVGDVLDSFIDVGYRFQFQVINMYMMH